jgi:hypothetical protein
MIPNSVNDLTVRQFIEFENIRAKKYEDELARISAILSYFTKLPASYFENISINKRDKYIALLKPLLNSTPTTKRRKAIWIKGKRYVACKDERDFNTNQWTALKQFEQNRNNMHKVLALFYCHTPLFKEWEFKDKEFNEVAELMLDQKIKKVHGTFFFYLQRSENLNLSSLLSLELSQIEIEEHLKEVYQELKTMGVNTDGSILSIKSQAEAILNEKKYSS